MTFPDSLHHLVRTDEPLAPLVWLGIGGPARYFAEPTESDQVRDLVAAAQSAGLLIRILGGGSNVLVRESGVDGVVISLAAAGLSGLQIDGSRMIVGGGAKLSHAVIKAVGAGLGGLEHLVGIPGSVAAAVVGNSSSDGRDIGSAVDHVVVLGESGTERTLTADEIGFSHRKSSLAGLTVMRVVFELEPKDVAFLTKRMQKLWINRNATLPPDIKRIAMPFIDPDGIRTRDLIQQVGLAGIREGEVSFDPNHPQYMVAHEGATSDQCLKLIDRVREQVLLQTGIDLHLNLQIW